MKIYIDSNFMCHPTAQDGFREFSSEMIDEVLSGKCAAFIEGYRYVPQGETWTRSDGVEFNGEMISPAVDSRVLEAYQAQYEAMLPEMTDMQTALETLGVTVDG